MHSIDGRRRSSSRVEATRAHWVLVKPCCGERVRVPLVDLDPSAGLRVPCPDCPLALFAPFEWTVTLRRDPGGRLTADWGLHCTSPRVWEADEADEANTPNDKAEKRRSPKRPRDEDVGRTAQPRQAAGRRR